jgi:hypothetical protein
MDLSIRTVQRLLNHYRWRDWRGLLPFGVCFALLILRALARGDLIERTPLGFHAHMGITRKHGS